MSESKVEPRHDRASMKSHGRRRLSRHRAETAAVTAPAANESTSKPVSESARAAKIPSFRQRAAVVATACAVLIGVGAAGQASEPTTPAAVKEPAAAEATAAPRLDFEKILISAQPAPAKASIAPKSAEAPAAKPAPKPAAPAAPAAKPAPVAKPAVAVAVNDPAGAQEYAAGQLGAHGWAADQMQCLKTLWTKESGWSTTATNASSGAYGIVQSLPAEKMASSGADYRTSYRTQINWGLDYIGERYGSPCGALNFHLANNWY